MTGGTTGTGKATALLLARNSVNVLIVGLEEVHLEKQSPTFGQVAEARVYGILAEWHGRGYYKHRWKYDSMQRA